MIYLDYAATTPVDPEVSKVIYQALQESFANPSSIYQSGKRNKFLVMEARQKLASLLNVEASQLYFTSGATEANNWAIKSQAYQSRNQTGKTHIVATAIEHPSVGETLKHLESQGFKVTYLKPKQGQYRVEDFLEASTDDTIGWVAMWVNNELGTILPVESIGKEAKKHDFWFHVDAVQRFASGECSIGHLEATSVSASAHKVYGPKGIGFLVFRPWDKQMKIQPLIHGGGQEFKKRSGTENLPYILGLVKAFELINKHKYSYYEELQDYLMDQLRQKNIAFERNGVDCVPYIVNLFFPDMIASQLLIQMDLSNIAISAGSACSAGSLEKSHVLQAYFPDDDLRAQRSIRLSFGKQTNQSEIDFFVQKLETILRRE